MAEETTEQPLDERMTAAAVSTATGVAKDNRPTVCLVIGKMLLSTISDARFFLLPMFELLLIE